MTRWTPAITWSSCDTKLQQLDRHSPITQHWNTADDANTPTFNIHSRKHHLGRQPCPSATFTSYKLHSPIPRTRVRKRQTFHCSTSKALNTPDDCTSPHRHQSVEQAHLTSPRSPNASYASPQTEQKQFVSHKRLNWSDAIMGYLHLHLLSLHLQKRPL